MSKWQRQKEQILVSSNVNGVCSNLGHCVWHISAKKDAPLNIKSNGFLLCSRNIITIIITLIIMDIIMVYNIYIAQVLVYDILWETRYYYWGRCEYMYFMRKQNFLIPCLVHRIIDIPITQRELLKRSQQHIDAVVALQILKIYYLSHVIILFHVDLLNW